MRPVKLWALACVAALACMASVAVAQPAYEEDDAGYLDTIETLQPATWQNVVTEAALQSPMMTDATQADAPAPSLWGRVWNFVCEWPVLCLALAIAVTVLAGKVVSRIAISRI